MKYSEIKQLSGLGNYTINVGLKYIKSSIEGFIDDYGLDLNPDFQRGYVWTKEQKERYIEYILKGGRQATTICFNHPGWEDMADGNMIILDGKQRLSSMMGFVDNKVKAFGLYYNEFDNKVNVNPRCNILFNVNSLKTREEVLQWYIDFNTGGTVHPKEEINKVKRLLKEEQAKNLN